MEGSGLEFDCCIVNLENIKKFIRNSSSTEKDSIAVFPTPF
jgi:hypothetical protein